MSSASVSIKQYIEILIEGQRHLTADETEDACNLILQNVIDPIQIGSFLTLLRARVETADEITGIARAMKNNCLPVLINNNPSSDTNNDNNNIIKLLDIVGTGGDGADTINISTAATVVAAAAGCIVAKAGNRSVSSACGSADVLEAIGVKVDLVPTQIIQCVQEVNIAFMFAPINHPAMKYVAPVRKSLGVRTCFNIVGPLINAANAQYAVIGVFDPNLIQLMASTLKSLNIINHAVIIHGVGLDEISPLGPCTIHEIQRVPGTTNSTNEFIEKQYEFDPLSIGIERCTIDDLRGGVPKENAEHFITVLKGGNHTNAKRDAVVLNAGVGCYVYGLASSIEDGCTLARTALYDGKAEVLLSKWISCSQEIATKSTT